MNTIIWISRKCSVYIKAVEIHLFTYQLYTQRNVFVLKKGVLGDKIMGILRVATLLALIQFGLADRPSDPQPWPHQFTQKFTETFTYPVVGSHNTKGMYVILLQFVFSQFFL